MKSTSQLNKGETGEQEQKLGTIQDSMKSTRANLLQAVLNSLDWPENQPVKILILGLSGAGKSTLVEFIEKGAVIQKVRTPTLSFSRLQVNFGHFKIIFIDAPGQQAYWKDWTKYIDGADGILFLLDSSNFLYVNIINNLVYETLELHKSRKPVLFLANKQDLPTALEPESISQLMRFKQNLPNGKIYGVSAINGKGIIDAFRDFMNRIKHTSPN